MQFCARRYDTAEPVRILIEGEQILAVEPVRPTKDVHDWPYVAPGLFDLQINGYGGIWFSDETLTPQKVLTALAAHYQHGITRMCPTLITNSFEALHAGFTAIRTACESEPWADRMVPGCHLEGPYISSEDGPRGAHPLEHVRGCDWEEFRKLQAASGDRICLVTLAAEADGACPFIRTAVEHGVTIAIGHTAADSEQIRNAVDAGARLSTHLGNGAHGTIRRHPNYIWDQLGDSRLTASIITDGHHLPPSVVRSFVRAKGLQRIVITCDASGLAGCKPGVYDYDGGKFEVLEDGPIVIAGQRQFLAGSGQQTDVCVANAIAMAGLSLGEACDLAARAPARLLGQEVVRLSRGSRADLMVFDYRGAGSPLQVLATIASGDVHYGSLEDVTPQAGVSPSLAQSA
ncbi:MAG: N-acetylglucosamine-6-phosphate deacetylase [Planctomycetota bacterium]|nr:MAG: N-acetylglucosamine-6-phosphate deacetylase [Planctomycetota bacterium]REK24749.1 MAG: N-acetylglucosamine-6-phosphate deacetylase [Planctomycetota bacterium]REK37813.1 MAG: N-acetylglucosamine-6-phosphate deacetylase [Planctomycetota bacterium]